MKTKMRLKRKVAAGLVLALSAIFGLGACTSGQGGAPKGTVEQTAEVKTQTKTAEEKVDLLDPRSLSGVSAIEEIGAPKPLEGDWKQNLPVTLTDHTGKKVTVKDTSRILALDIYGTITRVLLGLGLQKNLVGRTVSDTEDILKDLPVVTENGHSLNVEAIVKLKPTVIIADNTVGPVEAFDQFREIGIPLVMIDPTRSIEKNSELIMNVAKAVGMPEAGQALVERTDKQIQEAKAQIQKWVPKDPLKGIFLYVRGTAGVFYILGEEYGASSLLQGAGVEDMAVTHGIKRIAPASAESLVKLNPEVYFMMTKGLESTGGLDGLLARPGVKNTTAGQKPRIIAIPDGLALSYGPQTGEVMLAVAKALYGIDKK